MITIRNVIQYFEEKGYEIIKVSADFLDEKLTGPRAIDVADSDHITFISTKLTKDFVLLLQSTQSKVVLVEEALLEFYPKQTLPNHKFFIICKNPKQDIIDFSKLFFSKTTVDSTRIHPSAVISDDVIIGDKVQIGPNVTIEDNCKIGINCVIGAGTVIKSQTEIGDDVLIGSCNVIGGDGFGYVRNESTGSYDQFPHFGGVKIMNKVHIGNNTCIDRGSLKDTVIGEGVKIDNLVHIAHNVRIGKNSIVIACSMVAGSVVIEENCWVAPGSNIRNAVTIYEGAVVGLGSTVTKDVESNQTVVGNPALSIDDFQILRAVQKKTLLDFKANLK